MSSQGCNCIPHQTVSGPMHDRYCPARVSTATSPDHELCRTCQNATIQSLIDRLPEKMPIQGVKNNDFWHDYGYNTALTEVRHLLESELK